MTSIQPLRVCPQCSSEIPPDARANKVFCSRFCCDKWNNIKKSTLQVQALCKKCGTTFQRPMVRGGPPVYCSLECKKRKIQEVKYSRRSPEEKRLNNHRRRARHFGVAYEPIKINDVMDRDHWICGICHTPIDPDLPWPDDQSKSVDHIVPMSRGGGHVWSNVQAAHLGCNTNKGVTVG